MASPFLGEIRYFSFDFPPNGWAFCNGQLLSIAANVALFSLLGTTYGGNGTSNFALPNLQGRVALGQGNGMTLGGQVGSNPTATSNLVNAVTGLTINRSLTSTTSGAVTVTGAAASASNHEPSTTLNACIALQGIFPSQN